MASIQTRYGYSASVNDPNDPWITQKLIAELRSEQFDTADYEHTQVSVSNGQWAVTAQVSGLITFDNLDLLRDQSSANASKLPAVLYLRNISDEALITIWQAVVRCDSVALLAHPWQPELKALAPYLADWYKALSA
jgi:hypothetical protein